MTSILVILESQFKGNYLKNQKLFMKILLRFLDLLCKKKNELHSLNISEIIDSEERGYLNAWKILFQNTPRK